MNIAISFAELSAYISAHCGKTLTFEMVSEKVVRVSYSQHLLVKTIKIPLNIKFDEVRDGSILVTYDGGLGIDMIITGALSFMKAKLPELAEVIVYRENHQICIDLAQLPQTKALVEKIQLNDILVHQDGFEIKTTLK